VEKLKRLAVATDSQRQKKEQRLNTENTEAGAQRDTENGKTLEPIPPGVDSL